jgi:class 3 adenylate cyclase/DNA polymerase III delta prime subunit
MPSRRLTDKAIDLVDQACARRLLSSFTSARVDRGQIGRDAIVELVVEICRLPPDIAPQADQGERDRFEGLQAVLAARVLGQPDAVKRVADAIRNAFGGLKDPRRPVASFLFAGPTGVGKTELAKAIADAVFGPGDSLLRLDMSEFKEKHSVARLVGAPPGYVGYKEEGQLTGGMRRRGARVVLFDEIEKAHPEVLDLLLQMLDEGILTDAQGRPASFREAIVVMTSNVNLEGAHPPGFRAQTQPGPVSVKPEALRARLAEHMRPELVGRIGDVILFRSLDEPTAHAIVEKLATELLARLRAQGTELALPVAFVDRIVKELGKMPFGARDAQRLVVEQVGALLDDSRRDQSSEVVFDSFSAPSRVETAMLLLDIVKSTRLVQAVGDTGLVFAVETLVRHVRTHPAARDMRFLKCTGDGVLALFSSVSAALDLARGRLVEARGGEEPPRLRRVIHWGRAYRSDGGEPLGLEVHRLFAVEAVTEADRVTPGKPLPLHGVAVLTAAAVARLPEDERAALSLVGSFRVRDFDGPTELWADDPPRKER